MNINKNWFNQPEEKKEEKQEPVVIEEIQEDSNIEVIDGVVYEKAQVETEEELFERLKKEEQAKAKRILLEKQAKEEALREVNGSGYVIEGEGRAKPEIGRRHAGLDERLIQKKADATYQAVQEETDSVATKGLDSDDVPESFIEQARNKEVERQFIREWDLPETIVEDITEGKQAKEWQSDEDMLAILDYVIYVFGYNKLSSEVYKERTKNELHKILMEPERYANYRHAFRDESYEAILGLIPKHTKLLYSEEYLKDTFILLNIIYKYGHGAFSLDIQDVIKIIIANNDHLPATVKYGIPYTVDFLTDLSTYHVFTSIQNLCIDEQAMQQVVLLMGLVRERIQQWKETGEQNAQEMRQAADTLERLDKINQTHSAKADSNKDTVVVRVPDKTLDYSRFLHIVPHNIQNGKKREFVYFISASAITKDGKEELVGWVHGPENKVSTTGVSIFNSDLEVSQVMRLVEEREEDEYSYEVHRFDKREKDIYIDARTTKDEEVIIQ